MTHQTPSRTMEALDSPLIKDKVPLDSSVRRYPVVNSLKGSELLKGKIRLPGWNDHSKRNISPTVAQTYYRVGQPQFPVNKAHLSHSLKKRQSQLVVSKTNEVRGSSIENLVKVPRIALRKSIFEADTKIACASGYTTAATTARRDPVVSNLACRRSMNMIPSIKLSNLPYSRITQR
jgi:hypothetical protein